MKTMAALFKIPVAISILSTIIFLTSTGWTQTYFGPGLGFNDNNNNIIVGSYYSGSPNYKVLMSFRAIESGNLTKFRTYFQSATTGSGYSSGTCGTMRIRIWPSNGANPPLPNRTGTPLSQGQKQFNCTNGNMPFADKWSLITLTPNRPLTANELYFIEIANIDPNPSVNWVSVNSRGALTEHVTTHPHMSNPADWGMYWEDSSIHNISTGIHPNLYRGLYNFPNAELGYEDGTYQGFIRLEQGNWDGYIYTVNSSTRVRERFNVTKEMQVTGVEIHASASVAGSLSVSFIKNGATVATGTITESPARYRTSGPNSNGVYSWYTVNLPSANYFTVNTGDTLDIQMTAVGSAVWRMSADRTGVGAIDGASAVAMSTDSSAQVYDGSQWVNTLYYQHECPACAFANSHWRVILKTGTASAQPAPPTNLRVVNN